MKITLIIGLAWLLAVVSLLQAQSAQFPGRVATAGQNINAPAEISAIESKLSLESVSVTDQGADPSGREDSAPAFSRALDKLRGTGNRGGRLLIPPGTYTIKSTIVVQNFYGLDFAGSGWRSVLNWAGDERGPVVKLEGNFGSHLHDFLITIPQANPVDTGVEITDGGQGSPTSTALSINDVWIQGGHGYVKDGFVVDGQDANNDFHHFDNVRVSNYSDAGWWLKGSQAYSNRFDQCHIDAYGIGTYGVKATNSAGSNGGFAASFEWHGGGISSKLWDFFIEGSSDYPYVIDGADDESQGGLLYGFGGVSRHIVLKNLRWVRDSGTSSDSTLVHVEGGSLAISNSSFGSVARPTAGLLSIYYSSGGTNFIGALTIRDSVFVTKNFTLSQLLTGDKPNRQSPILENVSWDDDSGNIHGWLQPLSEATGTVRGQPGTPSIHGNGTRFTKQMEGGFISIQGKIYNVKAVQTSQDLTVSPSFAGPANDTPYLIGYGGAAGLLPGLNVGNAQIDDLTVDGPIRLGSASSSAGGNPPCPAANCQAPYTWIRMQAPDGSTIWVPAYK